MDSPPLVLCDVGPRDGLQNESVTLAPTMAHASDKINVIPSQAYLKIDCRVPPGLGEEAARRRIAEVLGDEADRVEIEFTEQVMGNYSPVSSLVSALVQGELMGSSLGPVLRAQSDQRRTERFLRAEKLAMLRQLTPEMAAEVELPKADMRGFKAALTRIAGKHGIAIVCTSDDKKVYIRLAAQSEAEPTWVGT